MTTPPLIQSLIDLYNKCKGIIDPAIVWIKGVKDSIIEIWNWLITPPDQREQKGMTTPPLIQSLIDLYNKCKGIIDPAIVWIKGVKDSIIEIWDWLITPPEQREQKGMTTPPLIQSLIDLYNKCKGIVDPAIVWIKGVKDSIIEIWNWLITPPNQREQKGMATPPLIQSLIDLYNKCKGIIDPAIVWIKGVKDSIVEIWDWLITPPDQREQKGMTTPPPLIQTLMNIYELCKPTVDAVKDWLLNLWADIKEIWTYMFSSEEERQEQGLRVPPFIQTLMDLYDKYQGTIDAAIAWLGGIWDKIKEFFVGNKETGKAGLFDAIMGFFEGIPEGIGTAVGNFIKGVGDMQSSLPWIISIVYFATQVSKFVSVFKSGDGFMNSLSKLLNALGVCVLFIAGAAFLLSKIDTKALQANLDVITGPVGVLAIFEMLAGVLNGTTGQFKSFKLKGGQSTLGKTVFLIGLGLLALALSLKLISGLTPEQFQQGFQRISACLTLVFTFMASLHALGADKFTLGSAAMVAGLGVAIFLITLSIGILNWIAQSIGKDTGRYGAIAGMLVAIALVIGGLFGFCAWVSAKYPTAKFTPGMALNIIAIAGAVFIMALALAMLSLIPKEKMGTAITCFLVIGGVLAVLMWVLGQMYKNAGRVNKSTSVTMLLSLVAVIGAIWMFGTVAERLVAAGASWEQIAAIGGSIAAVFLSMSVLMPQAAKACKIAETVSIAGIGKMGLIMLEVAGLAAVITGITIAIIDQAATTAEHIVALINLIVPMLQQIQTNAAGLNADSAKVLTKYVTELVKTVGAFSEMSVQDANDFRTKISKLQFATADIQRMSETLSGTTLDTTVFDNISTVYEKIGGLKDVLSDDDLTSFRTNLTRLGSALRIYSATTADISLDGTDVEGDYSNEGVDKALALLSHITENIDDGLIDAMGKLPSGEAMTTFSTDLVTLGTAINDFNGQTGDIDTTKATGLIDYLVEIKGKLQQSKDVFTFGTKYGLSTFSQDVTDLGTAIKTFVGDSEGTINDDTDKALGILDFIVGLNERLPKMNGIQQWWSGEQSLSTFATGLGELGNGMYLFQQGMRGKQAEGFQAPDYSIVEQYVDVITEIGYMASRFRGVEASSLSVVSIYLGQLGEGFHDFAVGVGDMSGVGDINIVKTAMASLGSFATNVKNLNGFNKQSVIDFLDIIKGFDVGNGEKGLGALFRKLAGDISDTDLTNANSAINILSNMSTVASTINLDSIFAASQGVGLSVDSGVSDGIFANTYMTMNAARAMSEGIIRTASDILSVSAGQSIGGYLVLGIATGISNTGYRAITAMSTLAEKVKKAFTVPTKIESPSRVFMEYGAYIDEGLAIGINRYSSVAESATEDLGIGAIESMSDAIDRISSLMESDIDVQPTIRPVLDLSNISNGAASINSLLGTSQAYSISSAKNRLEAQISSAEFNQNGSNMFNDRVLSMMEDLGNRVTSLGESMAQMQLVMDTGILVGAIEPEMDRQLGTSAMLKGRRN